jgi:hypothetical protein
MTAQFREITLHLTECSIELHPHGHHAVACDHLGIPDLALPVGVLVAIRIDHDILTHDFADLRRTGEVLVPISRQCFPLNIGEAKIIEPTAIEDGNNEGSGAAMGELALNDEIRRELVDGAADLLRRDRKRPLR